MKGMMMLAAVFCCVVSMWAQQPQENRNQRYNITLGTVQYVHHNEKMSTGDAVGKVLTGVLTGQTSVQATKYEADVKSAIVKGLSSAYRFRYDETPVLSGDDIKDGSLIVDAVITNIQSNSSTRTWKDREDKTHVDTYYTGVAEAMLTVKDLKTGEVIATPTLSGRGAANSNFSTSDQAIRDAIGRLSGNIAGWLNKYKPLQANIIEGASAKKDKQKEVYIDLGSNEGAFAGLHMEVYVIRNISGREAKSQIGKLKVEAVEGEDISRCKVQSGGKEIKAAIDAGMQLRVITADK